MAYISSSVTFYQISFRCDDGEFEAEIRMLLTETSPGVFSYETTFRQPRFSIGSSSMGVRVMRLYHHEEYVIVGEHTRVERLLSWPENGYEVTAVVRRHDVGQLEPQELPVRNLFFF